MMHHNPNCTNIGDTQSQEYAWARNQISNSQIKASLAIAKTHKIHWFAWPWKPRTWKKNTKLKIT